MRNDNHIIKLGRGKKKFIGNADELFFTTTLTQFYCLSERSEESISTIRFKKSIAFYDLSAASFRLYSRYPPLGLSTISFAEFGFPFTIHLTFTELIPSMVGTSIVCG